MPVPLAVSWAPVLGIALVLASCDANDRPTAPTEPEPAAGPRSTVAAAAAEDGGAEPPGTLTGTLGGGTSDDGTGPITLGEMPAALILVEIRVSGLMGLTHLYPLHKAGDPGGVIDAAGIWHGFGFGCWGGVQVRFSRGGVFQPCDAFNNEPLRTTWTARFPVRGGTVTARRFSGPDYGGNRCNDPFPTPCFRLSGSQTITVTLVTDELRVDADTNHVAPGTTVTFTASTEKDVPFDVKEWIWVPESPPADSTDEGSTDGPPPSDSADTGQRTVCGTDETCDFAVPEEGTMYARAVVNGVVQQAGEHVEVEQRELMVELMLHQTTLGPLIPSSSFGQACDSARYPRIAPEQTDVTVRTRYSDGIPAGNVELTFDVVFVGGSGGHDHQAEDRQGFSGLASGDRARTDEDGEFKTTLTAGGVGGAERIEVVANDGMQEATATEEIEIAVHEPGRLQPLTSGSDYILIGTETDDGENHLSNHWALSDVVSSIEDLAETMRDGDAVLQVNDISLVNGGKFDVPGDFAVNRGNHWSHRTGVDVDLAWVYSTEDGDRVFPRDDSARFVSEEVLKEELEKIDPDAWVLSHGAHFHLRFLPCPT